MYHFDLKPFTSSWSPARELDKEIDRLFTGLSQARFTPPCEIVDEEKAFSISMDIPGLSKEDVDIEVKDNQLMISGERKTAREKSRVLRAERTYGKFSRVFTLPQNVKLDAIEAHFENGVLEIIVPKEEKAQPRKIEISDWKKDEALTQSGSETELKS